MVHSQVEFEGCQSLPGDCDTQDDEDQGEEHQDDGSGPEFIDVGLVRLRWNIVQNG